MVTFTVPSRLRRFLRSHQRQGYAALFRASSEALKKLSRNRKHIAGGTPGFFGVLHTWGRQLEYHPHIHYIIPGGAFDHETGTWHPSRRDFFLPVRALSKIFRGKFRDAMEKLGLLGEIDPKVWQIAWNVNSQAVGSSEASLKYLAPYVFRVAISDSRIETVAAGRVTFHYRKTGSSRLRRMTLAANEFIRRYLQHVLPTGFMKIRYYGFLGSGAATPLDEIRDAIGRTLEYFVAPKPACDDKPENRCPHCGGRLIFWYRNICPPAARTDRSRPG